MKDEAEPERLTAFNRWLFRGGVVVVSALAVGGAVLALTGFASYFMGPPRFGGLEIGPTPQRDPGLLVLGLLLFGGFGWFAIALVRALREDARQR